MQDQDSDGVALLMVLLVGTIAAIAMASFGMFISLNGQANRTQLQDSQALYIAEAGVQRAVGHLKGQSNWATAPLPSPNPLLLPATTNQARVVFASQSSTEVTVLSYGYIVSAGYTIPSASAPEADKVRSQAAVQVTLKKVARNTIWRYGSYSDGVQNYHGVVHGSLFAKTGDIKINTNEAVYNDYSYVASKTPSWLQTYLNSLSSTDLEASVQAYSGDVQALGTGKMGTAADPLESVGVNAPSTVNTANYYKNVTTVPYPSPSPFFPTVASTQFDGTVSPAGEYDYRAVAADTMDPSNGCVWDSNGTTDGSKNLSITFGGDVLPCISPRTDAYSWDPANHKLKVNGTFFVDGNLTIGDSTYPDIVYEGRGLIVVNGTVNINAGLHPQDMSDFPAIALLGILTRNNMTINPPNVTPYPVIAGTFYTGDTLDIQRGSIQVGTVISAVEVKTTGFPILYQIPRLVTLLLPGVPNNLTSDFYITLSNWKVL